MISFKYILGALFLFSTIGAFADSSLQIGTIERKPFSYQEAGEWKGFSIDIWKEIALRNSFTYDFVSNNDFAAMLENTAEKKYDASVANISITVEREKIMDFSSPFYDSGLNIMALSENSGILSFYDTYSKKVLWGLWITGAILFILTHYFFIFNVVKGNITVLSYPKEIFAILYEVLLQIKETLGLKLLLPISGAIAILLVSFATQKFTIVLNSVDKSYAYSNPITYLDIKQEQIGVTSGSVGKQFLEKKAFKTFEYLDMNSLYESLISGDIDYIVADQPVLKYHAKIEPIFHVVGKTFNKDQYAIAFPQYENSQNADFIKQVNISILEMKEEGLYDEIYDRYFE